MARVKSTKPRNAGTMTESAFWSFIRAALRERTQWWRPRTEAKRLAKRAYIGDNKKRKTSYECNHCKGLFSEKEVEVDHIIPTGTLKCFEDLPKFVKLLFCEVEGLQVLCHECHLLKTKKEKEK
jgi:5-methylcytosine-specific restriction endonuclease McrA